MGEISFEHFINPEKLDLMVPRVGLSLNQYQEIEDIGLKIISQGKVCVVLNISGFHRTFNQKKAKCLHMLDFAGGITIIELFIKRLKNLGSMAIKKYGQNFERTREPILLILLSSAVEILEIDRFISSRNHFGY